MQPPADWVLPSSLRLGPHLYSVALGPPGELGEGVGLSLAAGPPDLPRCRHPLAAPPASLTIRPYDAPPQKAPALHYSQWSPQSARVYGRNFVCDVDFAGRQLTWWWPRRHWRTAAAGLWDLSVLAATQALALRQGGLLLHGAAVVLGGEAVVVTGPSGAGKSTLAARFPGQVLHDDVIALVPDSTAPSGWAVWSQDGSRAPLGPLPDAVALRRIAVFSADRSLSFATPLVSTNALAEIAAQTYFAGGMATDELMRHLAQLVDAVPLCRFGHWLGDSDQRVAEILWGAH